jgi:predicted ATPase
VKVTQLDVQGYRSLVDVSLPLRPLCVLIGPNGSGKTSFLEVIRLLQEAAEERLTDHLQNLGGVNALLSRFPNGPDRLKIALGVDVESQKSEAPLSYRIEILPRDGSHVIPVERLEWQWDPAALRAHCYIDAHYEHIRYSDPDHGGAIVAPNWDYHQNELALAQAPRMNRVPDELRGAMLRTRSFGFLDVGPRAIVRLPQALTPAPWPGPNGENLFSALCNLRALHDREYRRLLEVLGLAFPGFERLEFPVVGAGQVTMTWHQEELSGALYPSELSEGTLRFLWLATVLLAPDPPPITLIDEPEVSLHPEMLKLLANLLQDASCRGQVIVATHSSDLVRWLTPQEVLIFDKQEGRTTARWADELNLTDWLEEYSLDELWRMGTLGGRP